jgi:hypothetical protein
MCIADIAISRRCYFKTTSIPNITITRVPANPDRVAIYLPLGWTGARSCLIATSPEQISLGIGVVSSQQNSSGAGDFGVVNNVSLTYITHPGIVTAELYCIISGFNGQIIEAIMDDDLANEVRQYLKDQRSAYTRRG